MNLADLISYAPNPAAAEVHRGRTAISRKALSRPLQLAVDAGLVRPGRTVFDYGCGRGDDVRYLRAMGVRAWGWDPVYAHKEKKRRADVVNLGYVINVIEDRKERAKVLRSAWRLAKEVLVVSARLVSEDGAGARPYRDGFLTARGTFQKYYTQDSLRKFIEKTLKREAVAAGPGVFFVFKKLSRARNPGHSMEIAMRPNQDDVPRRIRLRKTELPYEPIEFDIRTWSFVFDIPEKPGLKMRGEALLPLGFVKRPGVAIEELKRKGMGMEDARIYIIHVDGWGYFLNEDGSPIDFEVTPYKVRAMTEEEAAQTILEAAVRGEMVHPGAVAESVQELEHQFLGEIAVVEQGLQDAHFWLLGNVPLNLVGKPVKTWSEHNLGIKILRTDILVPEYLMLSLNGVYEKGGFQGFAQGAAESYYIPEAALQQMPLVAVGR